MTFQVKQMDGFPSKICNNCISKLRIVEEFRRQCQESDEKLRLWNKKQKSKNSKENCVSGISTNTKSIKTAEGIKRMRIRNSKTVSSRWKLESVDDGGPRGPSKDCTIVHKSITSIHGQSSTHVAKEFDDFASTAKTDSALNRKTKPQKRSLAFRRITSMENLKKDKERQRRYLKKMKPNESSDDGRSSKNCKVSSQQLQSGLAISQYECTKCCRTFESEDSLRGHESSHGPEGVDQFVEFAENPKLYGSNGESKPSTCKICNKKCRKAVTMVRHLHVHKRENPRAVYAILKEIREKRTKYGSILHNENNKSLRTTGKSGDDENSEKPTPDRQAMSEKSNIFLNEPNDGEISLISQLNEIPEKCEIDDRSAIKLINSWIREELDSENEGKGFPCEKCTKSYVTKKSLAKHVRKMHDEFSRCDSCSENCICSVRIQGHRENTETQKKYRCNECDQTFEHESKLEKHMKIHKREKEAQDKNFKRFLCHICSKTFRHNTGLMFHMRTHTGYKPHTCKYCGRGFTSNSNCINHERTHTGDRPFVCHFCSAAFAKSCTLKAHITTHTGEANYHCKTCGKSFRRLKYLKEHSFTHTGEKPYVCKICGTAYSHSGSLFVHEKKCKAQHNNCPDSIQNFTAEKETAYQPNLPIDDPILNIQNVSDALENTNDHKIFIDDRINCIDDDVHSSHLGLHTNARNFFNIGHIYQA